MVVAVLEWDGRSRWEDGVGPVEESGEKGSHSQRCEMKGE